MRVCLAAKTIHVAFEGIFISRHNPRGLPSDACFSKLAWQGTGVACDERVCLAAITISI